MGVGRRGKGEGKLNEERKIEGGGGTDQIHSFSFLFFFLTIHKCRKNNLYVVTREIGIMESFTKQANPY